MNHRVLAALLAIALLPAPARAVDPNIDDGPKPPKKTVPKKARKPQPTSPTRGITTYAGSGGASPVASDLADWRQRVLGPIVSARDAAKRADGQQSEDFLNGTFSFPKVLGYYRAALMPTIRNLINLTARYRARTQPVQQLNATANATLQRYYGEAQRGESALARNDVAAWTAHCLEAGSGNLDAIINEFNSVAASSLLR